MGRAARPDNMECSTLGGRSSEFLRKSRIDVELTDTRNDNLRGRTGPGGNGQSAEPPGEAAGEPRSQVKIVVPADHSMVSLLGSGDELLHVIERDVGADIHVRGNEITATGSAAETALVSDLLTELT